MLTYTHFKQSTSFVHVSHFLHGLGWTKTWQELVETIVKTQVLADHYKCALGVGAPGPFELMVYPRAYVCSSALLFQSRPIRELTKDEAARLIPLIGNNGCGPDSVEDFLVDLQETAEQARILSVPVEHNYASLCDLIVKPNGDYVVVAAGDTMELGSLEN